MQARIKGVPAILLLVAMGAFWAWRTTTAHSDLEAGAAQELSHWLRAEYAREQLRTVTTVDDLTPAKVDSLLAGQNVTFTSVVARGAPDKMFVRAEILVDGSPPGDSKGIRYYQMSYSTITGWRMTRETTALAYYTTVF